MANAHSPRSRGVTLIELIITVSIAAVLLGLAIPSFGGMWQDSRRAVAVNALVHGIFLARSTAVTRGHMVTVCGSADGQTCENKMADWQRGWMVFVNVDRDDPPVRDASETVLSVQPAWSGGTITSNRHSFSFRQHVHGVVNGTVVFCDGRGPAHARAIIINTAGRPRISTRDSDNRPLRCPNG